MKFIAEGMIITIFWFLAVYTLKKENIEKLYKIELDKDLFYKILMFSKTVVILLLCLDIFASINPLNPSLDSINNVLRMPLISQGIILIEMLLVFSYGLQFSRLYSRDVLPISDSNKIKVGVGNGLFIVGSYIVLFGIKSILWGNLSYLYTLTGHINYQIEFVINMILFLVPGLIIVIRGYQSIPVRSSIYYTLPFDLLLILAQDIFLKVIILTEVINFSYRTIYRLVKNKELEEENDIFLLYSSCEYGSFVTRMNSYFLYALSLTVALLWTFQISPYKPVYSLYSNGSFIIVFFGLAILFFWLLERLGRRVGRFGYLAWSIYIPIAVFFIVFPFYTSNALLSVEAVNLSFRSLYHIMIGALSDNSYFFFLSLVLLQGSFAYCIYIVNGTAKRKKNFYALLPMIIIVQVILATVFFTIIAIFPPYGIAKASKYIIGTILVVALILIIFISEIAHKLFTYRKIRWRVPVTKFFKKRLNLYIVVSLLTICILGSLVVQILSVGKNYNVQLDWVGYINLSDNALIEDYIVDETEETIIFLANNPDDTTMVINYSLNQKDVVWEKTLELPYEEIINLNNGLTLLVKNQEEGIMILDNTSGNSIYEYNPENIDDLEFFAIEYNNRAVLITEGTDQYIFDTYYGEIELETIGNNFYELIPGDELVITKNDKLYNYNSESFDEIGRIENLAYAKYYYYNENGLYIVSNKSIIHFNEDLEDYVEIDYKESGHNLIDVYKSKNGYLSTYTYLTIGNGSKEYLTILDTDDFSSDSIYLEQKITGFNDIQSYAMSSNPNYHILYDQNQFTVFENEINIGRYWFDSDEAMEDNMKLNDSLEPIVIDNHILWINKSGIIYEFNTLYNE